jgi:hypothetical protein
LPASDARTRSLRLARDLARFGRGRSGTRDAVSLRREGGTLMSIIAMRAFPDVTVEVTEILPPRAR